MAGVQTILENALLARPSIVPDALTVYVEAVKKTTFSVHFMFVFINVRRLPPMQSVTPMPAVCRIMKDTLAELVEMSLTVLMTMVNVWNAPQQAVLRGFVTMDTTMLDKDSVRNVLE